MLARFAVVLALLWPSLVLAKEPATITWTPATVSLEIREPDGTIKKYPDVPWSLGLTVLQAMQTVDGLKFTGDWYYSLSDWLIVSIDGFPAASGSNWTFCVNGQAAGVGVGSYVLGPKAAVVWVYGTTYPPDCK
jgi:hypothetical protein